MLAAPEFNPPWTEGIVMGNVPPMGRQPLITGQRRVATMMAQHFRELKLDKDITLVRFARMEDIEIVSRSKR